MFAPLHRDHAIETVILRLTGSGEMAEHERPNLDRGYEKYWKVVLPMVKQARMMEIAMGPMPAKRLMKTQPVVFLDISASNSGCFLCCESFEDDAVR